MVAALKIGGPIESVETRQVVAVANVCGTKLTHTHTKYGDELKKAFLLQSPYGQYPCLDLTQGTVVGSTAIAVYIAQQNQSAKLLTGESWQLSQCISAMETCNKGLKEDPVGYLAYLDVFFTSNTYLCGERLSVADITVAVSIMSVEDKHIIPENVRRWLNCITDNDKVTKALKTQAAQSPKKGSAKKSAGKENIAAGTEKMKVVLPPKMDCEVTDLPPTEFAIDNWKRYYSNSKDLRGDAMTFLFDNVDTEGYQFWKVVYDKMDGECEKDYLTSNLLNGFLQSMPTEARKFGFAVYQVVGVEGDYNYEGVFLLRGKDKKMPAFMFDHRSFEYHHFTTLDVSKPDDKKYIIDTFCGESGEMLLGRPIVDGKQFK